MALINISIDTRSIVAELKGIRMAVEKLVAFAEEPSGESQQGEIDELTNKINQSSDVLAEAQDKGSGSQT